MFSKRKKYYCEKRYTLLIRLFRNCLGNRSDEPTPGKGRTIRKVMGGGEGNFRAVGIFFVIKFLYEFFLGHSMNIF